MGRKANWPPRIHHHQSGNARVTYRGEDYYLGPYGSPQAQKAYAELLTRLTEARGVIRELITPQARITPQASVADVAAQFLTAAESSYQPHQLTLFKLALAPVLRLCGDLLASEFDDLRLEAVRASMTSGAWMNEAERARREKVRQPVGWCRTTTNRHVHRVRQVWAWAERQRLVPKGSYGNLTTLKPLRKGTRGVREVPRRKGTARADLDAVLPFVQRRSRSRPVAAMLEFQFLTGCRSAEVCILRPCDIDTEGGPCIDGVRVWLYRPEHHKNEHHDQPRIIAIGPTAQALLMPWLADCPAPDAYLFRPSSRRTTRLRYEVSTYDKVVAKACRLAGTKLQPYGGRHSMRNRAEKAGGLDAARSVLGHATVQQTDGYGEKFDLEAAARVAAKLG